LGGVEEIVRYRKWRPVKILSAVNDLWV